MKKSSSTNKRKEDLSRRSFEQDPDFILFKNLYRKVKTIYNAKTEELFSSLEGEYFIPSSIFNKKISGLETIVKFLREKKGLKNIDIAKLTKRSEKTIWQAFNSASKKHPQELDASDSKFIIPVSLFTDRSLSVLEHIVVYLKETYNLSFAKIGQVLKRSDRTIWTVYNRANKKQKQKA